MAEPEPRYAARKGAFADTGESDLLDNILKEACVGHMEQGCEGAPGGHVWYWGIMAKRWNLADCPARAKLQLRLAAKQHMRARFRSRKQSYPHDPINKQQSGKIGRKCLHSACCQWAQRSEVKDGEPGSLSNNDIFAVTLKQLRAVARLEGDLPLDELFKLAMNLDCRQDMRWAAAGPGAKLANLCVNVAVSGNTTPPARGYAADYIFYGVRLAACAHGGCCSGGKYGFGEYPMPFMRDSDTRYGWPSCWWATTWCPCECLAYYRHSGVMGVEQCECLAPYRWKPYSAECEQ